MTDLLWPPPNPKLEYGLYHYRCECPLCGKDAWSDKGMMMPERNYRTHWIIEHSGFIDPGIA